jgi:hypothetical protein
MAWSHTKCVKRLVFGREMILNVAFKANWNGIQKRKQDMIHKSLTNKIRVAYLTSMINKSNWLNYTKE